MVKKCRALGFLSSTLYGLFIETKKNFVNQNKGKIILIIFPWDWVSLAMSWRSGSFQLKAVANKKEKNTLSIFMMVNAIPWEVLMSSTKCEGLSYPTHFLKSRSSVFRNNFLEYRSEQATFVAWQNDYYALFATNKAKHKLNRHFSCSWPFCSWIFDFTILLRCLIWKIQALR